MNNFKSNFKKGEGRDFGVKPKFERNKFGNEKRFDGGKDRARDSQYRELFPATCANCNKRCEVPFKPSGDRPVLCSECFGKNNSDNRRDSERRDGGRDSRRNPDKPPRDQRSPRHDRPQAQSNNELVALKQQLEKIETRLNRILDILKPPVPPTKRENEDNSKVVEVKKPAKKTTKNAITKKSVKKVAKKNTKKAAKKATKKIKK